MNDRSARDARDLRTPFRTKFQWCFFRNALRKSPLSLGESSEKASISLSGGARPE
jgi:hypothetical protein